MAIMEALHFKTKCKNYATVKKKEIFPHKMYIHTEKNLKATLWQRSWGLKVLSMLMSLLFALIILKHIHESIFQVAKMDIFC